MVLGKPAPRFLKALEPAVLLELLNSPHSVAAKVVSGMARPLSLVLPLKSAELVAMDQSNKADATVG